MPFDINEFMRRVRAANPHYERFKSSSLHTLVDVLKRPPIPDINSVQRELAHLPAESLTKYSSALEYMKNTVQGLKSDDQKAHKGWFSQRYAGAAEDTKWHIFFTLVFMPSINSLRVIVPIKATTQDGAAAGFELTSNWRTHIHASWSNKYKIRRAGNEQDRGIPILFDVQWTDSDLNTYPVTAVPQAQTAAERFGADAHPTRQEVADHNDRETEDLKKWGIVDRQALLHEFGHMIGNPDEYQVVGFVGENNRGYPYDGNYNRAGYSNDSIMNNPRSQSKIYPRHYTYIRHIFEEWKSYSKDSLEVVKMERVLQIQTGP